MTLELKILGSGKVGNDVMADGVKKYVF